MGIRHTSLLACVFALGCSHSDEVVPSSSSSSALTLPTVLDIGDALVGATVPIVFPFQNLSGHSVTLQDLHVSCTCTDMSISIGHTRYSLKSLPLTVPPGHAGRIDGSLQVRNVGPLDIRLGLHTDSRVQSLQVSGTGRRLCRLRYEGREVSEVRLGDISHSSKLSFRVALHSDMRDLTSVSAAMARGSAITVLSCEPRGNGVWVIDCTFNAGADQIGATAATLQLTCNGLTQRYPVLANVRSELELFPAGLLSMGVVSRNKAKVLRVAVARLNGATPVLSRVQIVPTSLRKAVRVLEVARAANNANNNLIVHLEVLAKASAKRGRVAGHLVIACEEPACERKVRLVGFVN